MLIKKNQKYCLDAHRLVETTASEVVSNDDIGNGVEDKLDVLRVRGAGHVAVDLLRRRLVLGLELGLDVGRRLTVLLRACNMVIVKTWPSEVIIE